MDLSTKTPVEIDTTLAEIYGRYYDKQGEIARQAGYADDLRKGLEKKAQGDLTYSLYTQEQLDDTLRKVESLWEQASAILGEASPYNAEYNRRPWTRFFLVQNNGGHIHSSQDCSTCYSTTRFGWLPNLSGQTEPEAVAAHGAILCTVCYPTAPVEWTDGRDDSVCKGSGTWDYDRSTARTGYYAGNYGTCEHCGERVTLNKGSWKMRKHGK